MNMFESLKGKTALVTGALSGMGEQSALYLAGAGMNVVLVDITDNKAEDMIARVNAAGGNAYYLHCDITNEEEIKNTFDKVLERFGALHALVNVAGISSQVMPLHEIPTDYFDKIYTINLKGVFMMMKYGIKAMLKSKAEGCSIVNIASYSGIRSSSGACAYTASKFGVVGLTQNAAADYTKYGIRINTICPYMVKTGFLKDLPEDVVKGYEMTCANGRAAEPQEIASTVLFLVSEMSSYINGAAIPVDAGKSVGDIFPLEIKA